ncbi:MAG: hypothetical protein XD72_2326 [Methanothrix harundinacea]|uniref:Uncharacterized protein n=1 Tax=Methanothrix harundinacea TaxID=301375 RepID=A0A101FRT9_9EURY|nr:MAG: hypothetical protein XD72_2326 [Methanothrix harundinacea]
MGSGVSPPLWPPHSKPRSGFEPEWNCWLHWGLKGPIFCRQLRNRSATLARFNKLYNTRFRPSPAGRLYGQLVVAG